MLNKKIIIEKNILVDDVENMMEIFVLEVF